MYQQAGCITVIRRILEWIIFIPTMLSTLISMLKFMYEHSERKPDADAVMMGFVHAMTEIIHFNTSFLNFFRYNSPLPDLRHGLSIGFRIVFALALVSMALQASDAWVAKQAKFLYEEIESQLILKQAKDTEGLSRE